MTKHVPIYLFFTTFVTCTKTNQYMNNGLSLITEANRRGFKQGLELKNVNGFLVNGKRALGWLGVVDDKEWESCQVDNIDLLMNNGVILKMGDEWAEIV